MLSLTEGGKEGNSKLIESIMRLKSKCLGFVKRKELAEIKPRIWETRQWKKKEERAENWHHHVGTGQ